MRKKRAIIYDDEPMILELLGQSMEMFDYDVLTFDKPVVCPVYNDDVETCMNVKPCADVMITDLNMPKMNGIELIMKQAARNCKMDRRNKAVMSGNPSDDHRREIKALELVLIEKPFSFSTISNWLNKCEKRIDLDVPVGVIRLHKRKMTSIDIKYKIPSCNGSYEATVTNISACGLCINTMGPIANEETIKISTELPTSCQEATVKWVNIQPDSSVLAGLSCC